MSNALGRLLSPYLPADFVRDHWGRAPLVVSGGREKLQALLGSFDAGDFQRAARVLDSTAQRGESSLFASLPHDDYLRGRTSVRPYVRIRPDAIAGVLSSGASVQLNGLERFEGIERVARLAADLRAELHYAGEVAVGATLSPEGGRFDAHLDPAGAIVLQTAGRKRYWFSRAPLLHHPNAKAFVFHDGEARADESASERTQFSEDLYAAPVDLEPGDLLYMPAGTVHRTLADSGPANAESRRDSGPSVALLIIFGSIGFGRVLQEIVEREYAHEAKWRHLPVFLEGGAGRLPDHVRTFLTARLREVRALLERLDGDSLELNRAWMALLANGPQASPLPSSAQASTEPTIELEDTLEVVRDPPLHFALGDGPSGAPTLHLYRGRRELSVEGELAMVLSRLLVQTTFVARAALDWQPAGATVGWDDVRACLDTLLEEGVIRRATASDPNHLPK